MGRAAIAEIVRWLRERAADATVLHGVPAIEDFGVADPANPRTNAALADARLDAATAAVLALARAEAPVWMRLHQHGVALRERVVRWTTPANPRSWACWARPIAPARRRATPSCCSPADASGASARTAVGALGARPGRAGRRGAAARRRGLGRQPGEPDGRGRRRERGGRHRTRGRLAAPRERRRRLYGGGYRPRRDACLARGARGPGGRTHRRHRPDAAAAIRAIAPSLPRASRALRACAGLLRLRGGALATELARAAAQGVSLNLVLSDARAIGRRHRRLLRHRGVAVCPITPAHPGFAGVADQALLAARLDALLAPAPGGLAAPRLDAAARALADSHAACAAEALRVIARSSKRAA